MKAAEDPGDRACDNRARGRACQHARPRDKHRQRQDLAQPLHGDEQVVAPSKDIEKKTAAPLKSKMPAVAPCPSSKRQAKDLAKTTRSKARRREQGSKNKLRRFCLADIPTAAVRCRHCTSVLNHAEWRRRGGRHISMASQTTRDRRQTAGGPVGPSTDKSSEPKEVRSDGQRQRNQRTCVQHYARACRAIARRSIATTAETARRRRPRRDSHRAHTSALHVPYHTTARAGVG